MPKTTIDNCARCKQKHEVETKRLTNPPVIDGIKYNYWATCPETGEPILMYEVGAKK